MKKLKLLIVSIHIKNSPQAMPLAAALLKAQLDSVAGIREKLDVSLADFYIDSSPESIADKIEKENPEMIGFSVYLWNRQLTEKVCKTIKNRLPETILFAGGAEATALPEDLLHSAPFDFVIKGEGELVLTETVKRILERKSYDDIKGVYTNNAITTDHNEQWPVADLNSLPSPFLTGVLDIEKYAGILWELSRGCPFKCSFCFESRGVEGTRQYSLTRIGKELELFESKKARQVFVLDPTFNRDVKRAKNILRMIQKAAPLMHFTFEIRAEFIDAEMAALFARINCSLQIGLQSAIPEVLSNVNRKIDPVKYREKISLLNDAGVIFGLDLIYGLPGDTYEGFRHSLDFALRLQPNHLDIFPLAVLPGTALFDEAGSFSLSYLKEAPYTLLSSPEFSERDLAAAESLKNACEIFYNKGGAAGWMFMVYETLGIEPSGLLESFSVYMKSANGTEDLSGDQITAIQTEFVKELFSKHNKSGLFPVIDDIITLHGALHRSLYAGPYFGVVKKKFSGKSLLKLSPGTVCIELKYNYDELMTLGEYDLEEFLAQYRPEKTYLVIYNSNGEVKPLIVDKNLSRLLQKFTGENTLDEILNNGRFTDKDEAYEFIKHALNETILHVV